MAQSIDTASIYKTTAGRSAIMAWYDAKIKAFSITTESQDVSIQAGQTHITIAGENDAPPLIVLHGGFMNGVSMESVIVHFSKNHRVYAIDIIGMPGKSAETRLAVKGNDYSEWLVEVMQQLGLEKQQFPFWH